jgi:hypothetical protein
MANKGLCSVDGCGKDAHTRGFCVKHYHRVWRHGGPLRGEAERGLPKKWLLAHVDHVGVDCLAWPFARLSNGYPSIRCDKKGHVASRLMCEMANGPPPADWYEAAHLCGKGHLGCVNPTHLQWKTPSDNRKDRIGHGTTPRGAKNHRSKLTEQDVRDIRAAAGTIPHQRLAEKYGVVSGLISRVISRADWSWVQD